MVTLEVVLVLGKVEEAEDNLLSKSIAKTLAITSAPKFLPMRVEFVQIVYLWLFLNKQGKSPMVLRNGLKPLFSLKQALIFHLQATKLILET